MNHAHVQFVRTYVVAVAVSVTAVAVFNRLTDPYQIYRVIDSPSINDHKDAGGDRIAKAAMAERGHWYYMLLGSSRVQVGFEGDHPVFGEDAAYNFGIGGTGPGEMEAATRLILRSNRTLFTLLVGVDHRWYLEGFRLFGPDYANTILNPAYSRIEYHMGNMLGMRATEESIDVIKNVLRDEPGRYNRLGRRTHPLKKARQSHWQLFRASLNRDAANAPAAYLPSRMVHLESIIRMCDERGVELHLVFLPQHVLSLEQQHRTGQWPAVQRAKRDLTHRVAGYKHRRPSADVTVWDFWRYSKYTTEPVPPAGDAQALMRWHWESSHFTKELGDLVLWRIFEGAGPNGEPLDDLGVRLTPQNIDEQLTELEKARARFAAEHPQLMAIFD